MKKNHQISIVFLALAILQPNINFAQSTKIEGKAKVIAFISPFNKIKIDMLNDQNEFIQEFNLSSATIIKDSKGKPVEPSNIKPGSEIMMTGKKVGYVREVDEIKVTYSFIGDGLKISGVLEKYVPANDYAVIKGERIKLVPGVKIKSGSPNFKGPFNSFLELSIGNRIEIEGSRKEDKYIYASKAVVKENTYTADDQEIFDAMGLQFSSAHLESIYMPGESNNQSKGYDSVSVGYVTFGDAQYKLDTSKYLQRYVNLIGNKIIPFYIQGIPQDVPEKLNIRFYVLDNPLYNAFSLPNGMIFINSGLLSQLDNEAQLAAILGHEITHIIYKHAKERYFGQKKLKNAITGYYAGKAMFGAIKLGGAGQTVNIDEQKPSNESIDIAVMLLYSGLQGNFKPVAEEAAKLLPIIDKIPPASKKAVMGLLYGLRGIASNDHEKDNENDADQVGLYYMQEAGYDPRESAKIWEKFSNLTLTTGNVIEKLNQAARKWVTTSNMYSYTNPINQAGDMIVGKLIDAATDNWFSNYPKASARYRSLNQIISSYYSNEDFSKYQIGESEYKKAKLLANH